MYKILQKFSEEEGITIYIVVNRITNKVEGQFPSKAAAKAYVLSK
jgi:hypothetical protein